VKPRREGKKEKKKEVGYVLEAAALELAVEDAVYYAPQVHIAIQSVAVLLRHVVEERTNI